MGPKGEAKTGQAEPTGNRESGPNCKFPIEVGRHSLLDINEVVSFAKEVVIQPSEVRTVHWLCKNELVGSDVLYPGGIGILVNM